MVLAFLLLSLGALHAQDVVVGVDVVNPMRASVADQNAVFAQLQAAQVHVIRCGISNDDKGMDYAKRAAAKGIRIQLARCRRRISPECALAPLSAGRVSFNVGRPSAFQR
jgi:hypothetical protein